MAASPAALYLVAHRLAEPEGNWQAFAPEGWQKMFYSVGHFRAEAQPEPTPATPRGAKSAFAK
jgi:hypothetical protein